ncbi:Rho GTPase activation protein [Sporodiniella umbellata]|nr:Rho GTPase activation protein [Sporodiniella umbellata]
MSGVPMPNFMNVGYSLNRELNESGEEGDGKFLQLENIGFGLKTPELIIEEEEDSDLDSSNETDPEDIKDYWEDEKNLDKVVICQKIIREWIARRDNERKQKLFDSYEFNSLITRLQAEARRLNSQKDLVRLHKALNSLDSKFVVHLQTQIRGFVKRQERSRTRNHYQTNIKQLVKVQSFIKNKLVGNAYRRLTTEPNPSLSTVKGFIHLLDDSDLDFDRELTLEGLRQEVIEYIRESNMLESHVSSLDIQIALFLKNAITIEEVLKNTGSFKKKRKETEKMLMTAAANQQLNPFSLSGVDKESRQRLELFQQLIYVLQTEPQYIARLLSITNRRDLGHHSSHKLIESTVLSLFGYATNAREEYLLINLCKECISEELQYVESPQEFMRGNYTFMKLVVQTNRGAKERQFFRELFGDLIKQVVSNDFLDLELDLVSIYQKSINDEESRTGMPSSRPHAVTTQDVLSDAETIDAFVRHLRALQEITENFFNRITSTVDTVPYGIRIVARELRKSLEEKFKNEPGESIVKILGNFIYYRYLNPAIIAPEQYDVIDGIISHMQRKNLAEISKMLQRIASGSTFSEQDTLLSTLNDYLSHASKRFASWFITLTEVEKPEAHFNMDLLTDQVRTIKPVVYLLPLELFHLHYTLQNNLDNIEPDGVLAEIVSDLGESAYCAGVELSDTSICLYLSSPYDDLPMDYEEQLEQLLVDSKRLAVYVIKIQTGSTLAHIFEQNVTADHEEAWDQFKRTEFLDIEDKTSAAAKRRFLKLGQSEQPIDLRSLSFYQLKTLANRLVVNLAQAKKLSDENGFQEIVTMIARDITGKNTRRLQRDKEIARAVQTLGHLKEKRDYLVDQGNQYEGYLNSCMNSMANKRGKKQKFVFPFSRQYFHIRGLQKLGSVPKFGSYKYTAKQLCDRNVLLEVMNIEKKHYDRISIVLSMDQAGIITIEASYALWPMSSVLVDMRYEELLQTQFVGTQTMVVLDGMAKVNVNLLIYLVNKK